jgi:hypothetical protein
MNPSPKATPISPARKSGPRGRPLAAAAGQIRLQGRLRVRVNRPRPSTEPASQTMITSLRPWRSLRAPIRGLKLNWAMA